MKLSYPAELVKCVSPLVFVTNAILPDANASNDTDVSLTSTTNEGETLDNDTPTTTTTTATAASHKVSKNDKYFQSFLRCIALAQTNTSSSQNNTNNSSTTANHTSKNEEYGQSCNPGQDQCKPFDPLTAILSLDPLQVGTTNNKDITSNLQY